MFIKEYRFSCAHYTYVLRSKSSGSRAPHTLAFSSCSLSNVSWNPTCFADVFVMFQRFHSKTRRVIWTLFVAQCWTLWITRNKFTLEAKFPRKPANIIFKTLLLLQQWRVLQKPEMLPLLDEIIALLKDLYSKTASRQDNRQTWRPSVGVVSLPILLWTYSLACGLLSQNFVLRACSVNLKLVSLHVTVRPWGFINLKLGPYRTFGLKKCLLKSTILLVPTTRMCCEANHLVAEHRTHLHFPLVLFLMWSVWLHCLWICSSYQWKRGAILFLQKNYNVSSVHAQRQHVLNYHYLHKRNAIWHAFNNKTETNLWCPISRFCGNCGTHMGRHKGLVDLCLTRRGMTAGLRDDLVSSNFSL
jgi:hypothetical protein